MTSDAHTAITIVDYGMGNLRSVSKALDHLGYKNQVTHHAEAIRRADRLILPGVGAFGDAMAALNEYGIVEPIKEFVKSGRPFLGICLGMQLLMDGGITRCRRTRLDRRSGPPL